jgi:hypothetical protein
MAKIFMGLTLPNMSISSIKYLLQNQLILIISSVDSTRKQVEKTACIIWALIFHLHMIPFFRKLIGCCRECDNLLTLNRTFVI